MKSRRKIWSIPIAALAIVLMLAGALAVTGIVQANTVHGVTLTDPNGDPVPLVLAPLAQGGDPATRSASYGFSYDDNVTGNFEIALSEGGREITEPTDAVPDEEDDPATQGHQFASSLTPTSRSQTFAVTHNFDTSDSRFVETGQPGATLRTLNITLTLENAPPEVVQIPDAALGRAADNDNIVDEALADNFTDVNEDTLAFTAFVSNPKVGTVAFAESSVPNAADAGAVQQWWDSLDCDARNAALGLTGSSKDTTPDDTEGICQNYADLDDENETIDDSATVTQAFHWDILTGPEMEAVAVIGSLRSPASYTKPFSKLTDTQRTGVEGLYTAGTLARGTGNLEFDRLNTGSADITVKASDGAGRFLAKSVGQTFSVSTPLLIIGPDNDPGEDVVQVDDDLMTDGLQVKTNLSGVAAGQVGADVVTITTDAINMNDGPAFLITGADADEFYASRSGVAGEITTGSILAAGTYTFTVTAAVHGVDAAADVIVSVGHTNRAPEVVSGSTTSFMVLEQGQDGSTAEATVIHNFMNNFNDPDREVDLTYTLEIIDDEDDGAVAFLRLPPAV